MRGQSCNEFYRECNYFGICGLSVDSITEPLSEEEHQVIQDRIDNDFEITLSLADLIQAQLKKE